MPAAPAREAGADGTSLQSVSDVVEIPVVGRVAAGSPILAEENIEDSFPVPARFAANGTNFMLRVRGESMIEAGIMDGDLILVQQTETANNGEIVVAIDRWLRKRSDRQNLLSGVRSYQTAAGEPYDESDHRQRRPHHGQGQGRVPLLQLNFSLLPLSIVKTKELSCSRCIFFITAVRQSFFVMREISQCDILK